MKLETAVPKKSPYLEEKNRMLRKNRITEIYAATLKERNRIAREIHDNVGHHCSPAPS